MTESETEGRVRDFITENFIMEGDAEHLPGAVSLTQAGVLDSMGVLELVMFIEQTFGIPVPDEDTVPENLDTVDRIVQYVGTRLSRSPASHE